MNETVIARRQLYRFLYNQRVAAPDTVYERNDLRYFTSERQLEAALSFGLEKGHLETCFKHYFRMTADGMEYAENQGWMEDDD